MCIWGGKEWMVAIFEDCLLEFITSLIPSVSPSPSLVSLLTDLTVIILAVVGGGALLLFALGLIVCFVKKK